MIGDWDQALSRGIATSLKFLRELSRNFVLASVMKTFSALFLLFLGSLFSYAEEPRVLDDAQILKEFQDLLGAFGDQGSYPSSAELAEKLASAPASVASFGSSSDSLAEDAADAVYLIGSVYKCDSCDDWHVGGVATAWALHESGILVTNAHVLSSRQGAVVGVLDRNGNAYPVTEILAANVVADVALVRVAGANLKSLPLGPSAPVGSRVRVISHPQQRFFTETFGDVSRYYRRPARGGQPSPTWMSITADYARGSSGGPVLDSEGRVVGMVANTQSIHYQTRDSDSKGSLQMVIKNTVPVSAIAGLLRAPEQAQ